MKKNTTIIIALAILASVYLGRWQEKTFAQERQSLDREDVVTLTKPSVVRIVQRVQGKATIPAVKINLKNRSVEVDSNRPSSTISIDETLNGSGFIVSSDGYIATNSHVVSLQSVKIDTITNSVLPAMYESTLFLTEEESKDFFQDESAILDFSKKIFEYINSRSTFDVTQQIVVLNPLSDKEKLDDLISDGFSAQVVSVNDRFYDDDKDIALIKIDQERLPTLSLGSSANLWVGKSVSIFGFPATAELNRRNPLESTFTQGVISAIKDSQKKDFKVFQTDAKVSEGSSGGPLVDEYGDVVGIVTFQSGQLQGSSGDNFAFAIPIEVLKTAMNDSGLAFNMSDYGGHFLDGVDMLRNRHCQNALQNFSLAGDINETFRVDRYLAPYIARCNLLISSGQSVDNVQGKLLDRIKSISTPVWLAFGIGVVFVVTLTSIIGWLVYEVRKEEQEINVLERMLRKKRVLEGRRKRKNKIV